MKKRLVLLVTVMIVIGMTGCSGDDKDADDASKKDVDKENKTTSNDESSANEEAEVYPLTGLPVDDGADQRIMGVMINNHEKARPQTGLRDADIVFEILAEGRITRFLAMFQSRFPEVAGPVRSAREYFFSLADGYDAVYVYHGAANFIDDMIAKQGIEHLDGAVSRDGNLFQRAEFRQAPHNSYLQMDVINKAAENKHYDTSVSPDALPFLSDEQQEDLEGEEAGFASIAYSRKYHNIVEYDYDEKTGKYTRYNDSQEMIDRSDEKPIRVKNVFIVEASHHVIDEEGRREIDLQSGGDAYLLQNGKKMQVSWENRDGRIIPVKNGEPQGFVPGQTWVNVVPADPGLKKSVTIQPERE